MNITSINRYRGWTRLVMVGAALGTILAAAGCNEPSTSEAKPASGGRTFWGGNKTPAAPKTLTLPAGTTVTVALGQALSSKTNHSGDTFQATTIEPLSVDGRILVPAGATVHGTLTRVADAGSFADRAYMTLAFDQIVDEKGATRPIETMPIALIAKSSKKGDIEKVAAGGVAGAIIGAITGGKKGAAIGTVIGAGAGTAVAFGTDGEDIELSQGQKLSIHIIEAVELPVLAVKN